MFIRTSLSRKFVYFFGFLKLKLPKKNCKKPIETAKKSIFFVKKFLKYKTIRNKTFLNVENKNEIGSWRGYAQVECLKVEGLKIDFIMCIRLAERHWSGKSQLCGKSQHFPFGNYDNYP